MSDSRYNPWRHLRALPNITVSCRHELEPGTAGLTLGHRIWLHRRLSQAGRRATLAHELVHLERGPLPDHPHYRQREEATVEEIAARRLITLDRLISAMRWTTDPYELADELWVDLPLLQARLRALTDDERARITEALDQ